MELPKLSLGKSGGGDAPDPSPTTTSAPVIDADYPLWNLLPYKGKGFVVDRYIEPLTLVVAVRELTKKWR